MKNVKHLDCINKIREQIKKADPTIGYVFFELAGSNGITGQAIKYSEEVKKKDGSVKVVKRTSYVAHDYCPFCGEAYE